MVTGKHQERDLPLCCMRGRADTLRLQPPLPRHQDLPAGALPTIAGSRSSSKTPKYRRTFLSSCAKRGVNPAALTGLRTEVDDMWCASQITAHLLQGCSSRARARRAQEVSAANESALALNTQVQRSRCPRGAAGASSMAWSGVAAKNTFVLHAIRQKAWKAGACSMSWAGRPLILPVPLPLAA